MNQRIFDCAKVNDPTRCDLELKREVIIYYVYNLADRQACKGEFTVGIGSSDGPVETLFSKPEG